MLVREEDGELHVTLCKIAKGTSWNAVFVGDTALDAMVGEADRKRLMLERFQEEVREATRCHRSPTPTTT